ncbi:endonuclease-reverse transcriptase [Elysia marginata]|uniref:Endonuclease-reverse transcriptase n=1 Tax=Elysia marginata TaxID=1093978 RepID=A0AAV4ETD3_9GAST|nr:endonuclease-reverse transcriptase [Elysia marginata]
MDINIIQVYAPTSASSNEDLEKFYEELEQAKSNCKKDEPTFIMGDFNAKVGERGEEKSVGQHGLGIRNEKGEHLLEWCETNDLLIANICFKQPPRRKWTWKKPGDDTKNQIDYILVNDRFKNALLSAKSYPGADCFSDHVPVVAVVRLKLKKIRTQPGNIKLNIGLLKSYQDLRQRYTVTVKNRFQGLEEVEEVEQHWQNLKEAITEAASTVIPPMRQKAKQKWMTDEILDLMDKRRQAKNDKEVYENLHRVIRKKCDEAKEVWLNSKCKVIDQQQNNKQHMMYKTMEEVVGKKTCSPSGCLKAKNSDIIMGKEKLLERWAEYIGELFDDDRKDHDIMKRNFAGLPILEDEVRSAIRKMKTGKATGPDGVSIELIEALEDYGTEQVTALLNSIYETGNIPADISKSIFVALPKKPGAVECEHHRTISLMSHITKILLRVIMMRVRNKIKPEIAAEQCGFVEGKGTTNAVFTLRVLIERALEVQKDVYLCFIDYTKAFDRIRHDEIIKELAHLHIDGNDLRTIKNMYWEQKAAMRVEGEEKLENMIITGMMTGRHCRGRQREKLTDGMAKWLGMGSVVAKLQKTKMRQEWRRLIANAMEQGT